LYCAGVGDITDMDERLATGRLNFTGNSFRLGAEGDGFAIAMMGLDGGRLNIGACSLGGARACWEAARGYMLERRQFGQRLADFQALQFKLADMATELDAARLMLWRAASSLDAGLSEATMQCAMAKRLATDAGFHVANEFAPAQAPRSRQQSMHQDIT